MINNFVSAIDIHNGGGLIYFLLIQSNFDKNNFLILIDYRAKDKIPTFKNAKVIFLRKGIFRNFRVFLLRIKNQFFSNSQSKNQVKEYFLNGLPPLFRFSFKRDKVYIFCQNKLVFDDLDIFKYLKDKKFKYVIYLLITKFLFNIFINKKDILIVQTNSMKKKLIKCGYKNKIILQEFIWDINLITNYKRIINSNKFDFNKNKFIKLFKNYSKKNLIYFYPAYFYPHKNHLKLLNAFKMIDKDLNKPYKLFLTITNSQLCSLGFGNSQNIILLDNPSFEEIFGSYKYIDYLIYPSSSESYGLPLIEAGLNNIDIIASDLEYVYDVCKPYLVFNPSSIKDISNKIKFSLKSNNRLPKQNNLSLK